MRYAVMPRMHLGLTVIIHLADVRVLPEKENSEFALVWVPFRF
jgi:hypothetical protein